MSYKLHLNDTVYAKIPKIMNCFNIKNAFEEKKTKNWDKLYWAIDLHGTIIEGKYNKYNEGATIYPNAAEVLKYLYSRTDMRLILWTSSHKDAIDKTLVAFELWTGIKFHYINENPECINTELCDFTEKFYFNILLDDKAGFNGPTDWKVIKNVLKQLGEWTFSGNYTVEQTLYIGEEIFAVRDAEDKERAVLYCGDTMEEAAAWIKNKKGKLVL